MPRHPYPKLKPVPDTHRAVDAWVRHLREEGVGPPSHWRRHDLSARPDRKNEVLKAQERS